MATHPAFDIRPDDLSGQPIRDLLALHLADLNGNSPPGTSYALDLSELRAPGIIVWSAWEGDDLVGCGALKEIDPRHGEIKSMRTIRAHLRRGVAAVLLEHIIAVAKSRGYTRLSLETGTSSDYEPAVALYRKRGFRNGPIFGSYQASLHNQFLHMDL